VLFYSTFVALKGQDYDPADGEDIHEDYYNVKEEILYGGYVVISTPLYYVLMSSPRTTLYPTLQSTVLKHALRVYKDKYTSTLRIESRPLRGRNKNVPLWVAFIRPDIDVRRWIRRTAARQVELRELEQHVFFAGYVPTLGRNRRFLIDFTETTGMFPFINISHFDIR
jgi:hypothetical protein